MAEDPGCTGKHPFDSPSAAAKVAKRSKHNGMLSYRCGTCKKWHVGTRVGKRLNWHTGQRMDR